MNYKTRILSLLLAAALCLSLVGCAAENSAVAAPSKTSAAEAAPAPSPSPDGKASLNEDEADADKEESVHVEAGADGTARQITVDTILHYGGSGGEITDRTNLSQIKNTEGDEEFSLKQDGTLLWEDHGERIEYEGISDQELPVTVHLTYWLDGREIAPADLAGKSGHLRIRFDYENHTTQTVTVTHADLSDDEDSGKAGEEGPETEEVQSPIPFLALSMLLLPEDVFSHVDIENGRLLTLGDSAAALGWALPGLSEALDLTSCELTEDVEIPDYVELEADVTDFSLDFTATIVSNGLLEEMASEDLDDIEELTDGMDELSEAMDEIIDGTGELADGADELADGAYTLSDGVSEYAGYIRQYVSGVGQVSEGASALRDGLSAVAEQTPPLRTAAESAAAKLSELRAALAQMDIPEMDSTAEALEAILDDIDTLEGELAALSAYSDAVQSAVSAADAALSGVDLDISYALDGLDLTDEQRQQVQDALASSLAGAQGSIDTARSYLAAVPDLSADPDFAAHTAAVSQAAAALREQVLQAQAAADDLPESPNAALDEVSALLAGVIALCDALDPLASGAGELSDGVKTLSDSGAGLTTAADTLTSGTAALADGADALADGADELTDGLEEFRDEGLSELTDMADDDLAALVTRLRALREADLLYDNFGGIAEGRTGSVRFIIETDSID